MTGGSRGIHAVGPGAGAADGADTRFPLRRAAVGAPQQRPRPARSGAGRPRPAQAERHGTRAAWPRRPCGMNGRAGVPGGGSAVTGVSAGSAEAPAITASIAACAAEAQPALACRPRSSAEISLTDYLKAFPADLVVIRPYYSYINKSGECEFCRIF